MERRLCTALPTQDRPGRAGCWSHSGQVKQQCLCRIHGRSVDLMHIMWGDWLFGRIQGRSIDLMHIMRGDF
jgi:hypothetical protein